jgi:hypothetical protein
MNFCSSFRSRKHSLREPSPQQQGNGSSSLLIGSPDFHRGSMWVSGRKINHNLTNSNCRMENYRLIVKLFSFCFSQSTASSTKAKQFRSRASEL